MLTVGFICKSNFKCIVWVNTQWVSFSPIIYGPKTFTMCMYICLSTIISYKDSAVFIRINFIPTMGCPALMNIVISCVTRPYFFRCIVIQVKNFLCINFLTWKYNTACQNKELQYFFHNDKSEVLIHLDFFWRQIQVKNKQNSTFYTFMCNYFISFYTKSVGGVASFIRYLL